MIWTAFSTEHPSGTERFAYWEAMVSQARFRTTTASGHRDDFLASSQALHLGDIQIFPHSCPPMHARRTPVMIRQGDPELLQLWLTVRWEAGSARRSGTPTSARAISCSATPCGPQAQSAARGRPDVSSLIVQISRARLPLHSHTLDRTGPS